MIAYHLFVCHEIKYGFIRWEIETLMRNGKKRGGSTVDDKNEAIFEQYEFKINHMYRARGAWILETDQGLKLYGSLESSISRTEFEDKLLTQIKKNGYPYVDLYVKNKDGEIITKDEKNNCFIIKDWYKGEECNLREKEDLRKAIKNLAYLHRCMRNLAISETDLEYYTSQNLEKLFKKHNNELRRVRTYLKEKKQKNAFELCYLNNFSYFYEQANQAISMLKQSNYLDLLEQAKQSGMVYHGNYTYHHLLFLKEGVATTHFEKAVVGIQVMDFYHFLRKVMEKNNWDLSYAELLLDNYTKEMPLTKEERSIFYILLVYPEKFWKITNCYFNGKKTWISQKNLEKLWNTEKQTREKEEFLKQFKKMI